MADKKCAYCGEELNQENERTDHVISPKRGGCDHLENKLTVCVGCNDAKKDMTPLEYYNDQIRKGALTKEFEWDSVERRKFFNRLAKAEAKARSHLKEVHGLGAFFRGK